MRPGNDPRWLFSPLVAFGIVALLFAAPLSPVLYAAHQNAPQAPICREMLVNGGFEEGATGWSQSSVGGYNLISNFHPHTGSLGAYLGGVNEADDRLSQQINIPTGVISATLRFWWAISTEEPGLGFDRMTVTLRRPDGTPLADLATIDSSAAENLWDQAEFDLTGYAGQSVVLEFHATTDATNLTDFYVDDASLGVCLAPTAIYLPIVLR
ncbi:MAG: hypothetical protein ACP5UQ_12385 [Anaerolineae bacterium]